MAKGYLTKNTSTRKIIMHLGEVGIFTIAALGSPYFLHTIIKKYFKEKEVVNKNLVRKITDLKNRKLISIQEGKNNSIEISLSDSGKKIFKQFKFDEMKIAKPKKWDGQWRIIIYDIPHKLRNASNAFRLKIKNMGLYRLQKSVWVSPYECIDELEALCEIFNIPLEKCLLYFKATDLPKEKEIKRHFDL